MIRFVDEHRDQYGVEAICRVLGQTETSFITSRGYRAAKARPASARALRDEVLLPEVRWIHAENYSVYGVRKMQHAMRRAGWDVGRDQVARLMRIAGLQGGAAWPEACHHAPCAGARCPPRPRRAALYCRPTAPSVGC